jgi:hypothetical protein
MTAAIDLILAIVFCASVGAIGKDALKNLEGVAKIRIQRGLPELSSFNKKLTCLEYDRSGEVVGSKAKYCHK